MPRKGRKRSKGDTDGGKMEECSTKLPTEKKGENKCDSTSSSSHSELSPSIPNKTKSKARRRRQSNASAGEVSNSVSTNQVKIVNKLSALLKNKDVQELLRKTKHSTPATATLSGFKIPKKGDHTTGNDVGNEGKSKSTAEKCLPITSASNNEETINLQSHRGPSKRQSREQTIEEVVSLKRRFGGVPERNDVKGIPASSSVCSIDTDTGPKSRPILTAKRTSAPASLSPPLAGPAQTTPVDTPQMVQLKAQMASLKKKAKKERKRSNPSLQQNKLESSPRTNIEQPIVSSTAQLANAQLTETSKTATMDIYNPVSEIFELVRNDHTGAYSRIDTIDAMDVDVIQAASAHFSKLIIIFDTNVWIGHQRLIHEVLDINFQVLAEKIQATLIIPWMVLQEIDRRIHSKTNKVAEFRSAAKFIHGLLSKNHPRVKGQKAMEAIIGNDFNELMADDSILNCAIKYSTLPQIKAVLVTNDINLLNKALVHGLAAFKADNVLVTNLHQCLTANSNSSDNDSQVIYDFEGPSNTSVNHSFLSSNSFTFNASPPSVTNITHSPNASIRNQIEDFCMDIDDPMGMEEELSTSEIPAVRSEEISNNHELIASAPPTFDTVATTLQQTLTSIIVPKMVEEYGQDGWKFAIKVKPPFTVQSGLKCIQAHWIAVFSFVFSSRSKEVVDELINAFHQKPASLSADELTTWRTNISRLALVLLTRSESIANRPRVVDCCCILQAYIQSESNNSSL